MLFVSIFVKSLIDVHQIARKMGTKNFYSRILVVQVSLRLAGACNVGKTSIPWVDDRF